MNKKNIVLLVILIVAAAFIMLVGQYLILVQKERIDQETAKIYQYNAKVLTFTKLFVKDVLKADGAVPLNEVIALEDAARDINDKLIYDEWQKFVNAKSPLEAQIEVKNLLEVLLNRVNY